MIEFKNVTKKYDNFTALRNINLTINEGEIFGLVGQSGAGKSTLLRTINKLEECDSGEIIVDNEIVNDLKGKSLLEYRKNVSMIFQHFSLLETLNVFENIALPLRCNGYKKEQITKRVEELLQIVGLEDKKNNLPSALSGGQKQRVAIARALALNPKILLCDEATSALDPITTTQILNLLREINEKFKITIVVVTHQMEVIKGICERIAILQKGEIIEVGKTDELFLNNSHGLGTLIHEDEILPKNGKNIRLYFPKNSTAESLITKMARDLEIDFSIVWGKLERFKENVLGSLVINVNDDIYDKVVDYISKTDVKYDLISEEE